MRHSVPSQRGADWATAEGGTSVSPLYDPAELGIKSMLDHEPPSRSWLVDSFLPTNVVGVLAATGGTGKSFLALQLAISVATGVSFLDLPVNEPGGVLMLCAEDDRDEMHRRLVRVVSALEEAGQLTTDHRALLEQRLFMRSSVGEAVQLTQETRGRVEPTSVTDRLIALAKHLPPLKLIVLDPVSRFRGDNDENSNMAATRFLEQVERLRDATGATVLLPHHVSKSTQAAGGSLEIAGMRGASALADGARWVAGMTTMNERQAKSFSLAPDDAHGHVRLQSLKQSYGMLSEGRWLRRGPGGMLVPTELESKAGNTAKARKHHDGRALNEVYQILHKHGAMTVTSLVTKYGGNDGPLKIGQKRLRTLLKEAVENGSLSYTDGMRSDQKLITIGRK